MSIATVKNQLPTFEPFSGAAGDYVALVAENTYDLLQLKGSDLVKELDSTIPVRQLAAYMIVSGYESGKSFGCDFIRKMETIGIFDANSAAIKVRNEYMSFPGFYEDGTTAANRAARKLGAGLGSGTELFLLRLTVLMSGGNPPEVTVTDKTLNVKSACSSDDKIEKYLKYGVFGLGILILGIVGYNLFKKK